MQSFAGLPPSSCLGAGRKEECSENVVLLCVRRCASCVELLSRHFVRVLGFCSVVGMGWEKP